MKPARRLPSETYRLHPLTVTLALTPAQWRAFQNLAHVFGATPEQVCAHVLLYGFWAYLKRHGVELS